MDYKITEKDQFTLLGLSRVFRYEAADVQVPALWAELERSGTSGEIRSAYGVSIDENMDGERFTYLLGEAYDPARGIPEGAVTRVIPRHTWAVFPCRGAGSRALPETHEKIFSEWLPGRQDYEIAAGYHVEWYGDPAEYARGAEDEAYYSEIWIPVRRK